MTDNEAKIRMLLDELADGYRRKDAAQIVSTYALEIRKFDLQPPLQIRRGETSDIGGGHLADVTSAEGLAAWFAGFGDLPFEYETRDLDITVGGDVAYACCLSRMGTPGGFGMWFRLTVGLRKAGADWQITHTHASTPIHMDQSGRAAMDLEP